MAVTISGAAAPFASATLTAGIGRGAEREASADKEQSSSESRRIAQLRQTDRRVRAHELAHVVAGDGVVRGGASFEYEVGPDGRRYAVGGEVSIDGSPGRTPEETLRKAQAIQRAALAPADPSPTDRRVAAQASAMAAAARGELAREAQAGAAENSAVSLYRSVAAGEPEASAFSAVA